MYNKLQSGGANYDIVIPSDYMIAKLIEEEMLVELDYSNIPNYKYILPKYKNLFYDPENKYTVPYTVGMVGLIYNTTMVDDEVDSWSILWDEKYKGETITDSPYHWAVYNIKNYADENFTRPITLQGVCDLYFINEKYGEGTATLELKHQYYNMRKEVEPHYHIVEKAMKAMEMEGIVPKVQPIRGGTDGANLSFMGLPCPNIFAGGHNFHGKMEYVPLESMEKASCVILNIISLYAE